jgi:hypothetical protein
MLRAILVTWALAFSAIGLSACGCGLKGCFGSIDVTFTEPAIDLAAPLANDEPWFTAEMTFGESTFSYVCVNGVLTPLGDTPIRDYYFGPRCSASGFSFELPSAPKAAAISVQAVRWSKSFDGLDADESDVNYPNGKRCGGGCRSSSFTL